MTTPSDQNLPADGVHTVAGIPIGYTSLTPFIVVPRASEAIDFYVDVFGASVTSRFDGPPGPDGESKVMHADLAFGHGSLQLSDPNPEWGMLEGVPASEGFSQSIVLYVPDVDSVIEQAVTRGAQVVEEINNFVSGDRTGAIIDPFGRRWAIMTRIEDLSPQESEARVAEWIKTIG